VLPLSDAAPVPADPAAGDVDIDLTRAGLAGAEQ
jgi:hypothetical protein